MAIAVLFIALAILLVIGVPVGFAIGGASMISMLLQRYFLFYRHGNSVLYACGRNYVYRRNRETNC